MSIILKSRTTRMKYQTDIRMLKISTPKKAPLLTIYMQSNHTLSLSLQFMKLSIPLSYLIDQKLSHTMTWISVETLPQPMMLTPGLSQFQHPKRKLSSGLSKTNEILRASRIKVKPRLKPKRLRRRSRRRNRRSRRNMPVEAWRALLRMCLAADTGRKRSQWSRWIMKKKSRNMRKKLMSMP